MTSSAIWLLDAQFIHKEENRISHFSFYYEAYVSMKNRMRCCNAMQISYEPMLSDKFQAARPEMAKSVHLHCFLVN